MSVKWCVVDQFSCPTNLEIVNDQTTLAGRKRDIVIINLRGIVQYLVSFDLHFFIHCSSKYLRN